MQSGTEVTLVSFSIFLSFVVYHIFRAVKDQLPLAKNDNQQLGYNFIAGAIGGTCGTILNVQHYDSFYILIGVDAVWCCKDTYPKPENFTIQVWMDDPVSCIDCKRRRHGSIV